MKCILLFMFIILSGCDKESKRNSAENSSNAIKDSKGDMNSSAAVNTQDPQIENSDTRNKVGYVKYGVSKVPASVNYSGSVVAMAQWDDKLGSNIVFITETAEESNEDTRSKELFGYHVVENKDGYKQMWKISDFIRDCPVDLTLDYIDKSLSVTDLDSNGIAESSFLYRMSCKGDVSSDDMKLLMHERDSKFALRGTMELVMRGDEFQKGSMTPDPSFGKVPQEFLVYAKDRWKVFNTVSIGE